MTNHELDQRAIKRAKADRDDLLADLRTVMLIAKGRTTYHPRSGCDCPNCTYLAVIERKWFGDQPGKGGDAK